MGYIYKITNDINDKVYIGKTNLDIQKRFREHCQDCKKRRNENRPLYRAMCKYGIDKFHVELVEETNETSEREQYWIKYFSSYGKGGYNATQGGDGKEYLNREKILADYIRTKNARETARLNGCYYESVLNIAKQKGIHFSVLDQRDQQYEGRSVTCLDKQGNVVATFKSYFSAGEWLKKLNNIPSRANQISNKISQVCRGERKSAYEYVWTQEWEVA